MTVTDRFRYCGLWGLAVGFALFYGWRIALPFLAAAIKGSEYLKQSCKNFNFSDPLHTLTQK